MRSKRKRVKGVGGHFSPSFSHTRGCSPLFPDSAWLVKARAIKHARRGAQSSKAPTDSKLAHLAHDGQCRKCRLSTVDARLATWTPPPSSVVGLLNIAWSGIGLHPRGHRMRPRRLNPKTSIPEGTSCRIEHPALHPALLQHAALPAYREVRVSQ